MKAFNVKKLFCGAAFLAALLLCLVDFVTSYKGIAAFIPENSESFILRVTPIVIAVLAISINATSAWLFLMLERLKHTDFTKSYLTLIFIGFLTYDGISSFLGLLAEFYGKSFDNLGSVFEAYRSIGPARGMLSAAVASLACFSPLLASIFWDLWQRLSAPGEVDELENLRTPRA